MEQDLLGQGKELLEGRTSVGLHSEPLTPVRAGIAAAAATELDEPELSPLFDLTRGGGRPARRERQPLPQVIRMQLPVANRKRTALAPLDQNAQHHTVSVVPERVNAASNPNALRGYSCASERPNRAGQLPTPLATSTIS